jgi:hypothetical protein
MFRNARHATRNVNCEISLLLLLQLWCLVREFAKESNLDYLKVFNISTVKENGIEYLVVMHTQEAPNHRT